MKPLSFGAMVILQDIHTPVLQVIVFPYQDWSIPFDWTKSCQGLGTVLAQQDDGNVRQEASIS